MQVTVEYLDYRIDAHGLRAIEKKVEAIRNAPAPKSQQQLRSFLGMINYYAKFISNYSTITHSHNELLRDGVKWKWPNDQEKSFTLLKNKLSKAPVLMHFTDKLPLKLDTGDSQYGVATLILHVLPSGKERLVIAYASRTLTKSNCITHKLKRKRLILFSA